MRNGLLFAIVTIPLQGTPTAATFQPLGDLEGGRFHSEAFGVSEDGRVVFGESASARSEDACEAFTWTEADGLRALGGADAASLRTQPRSATPDGGTIVGHVAGAGGMPQAARLSGADAPHSLGDLDKGGDASGALAVSADGSLVVGWGSAADGLQAVQWQDEGPPQVLADLPGGASHAAAACISRDRKTIAGTGTTAAGQEMVLWTEKGVRGLGDLDGGERRSEPFAMTPDAAVLVGRASSTRGMEAVRWTEGGGFEPLGDLEGGAFESYALGVSADGATVVGTGTSEDGPEAFVWTAADGMRRLRDVLKDAGVKGIEDWMLTAANGISGDGRVIVGAGVNPRGASEGWIVRFAVRRE